MINNTGTTRILCYGDSLTRGRIPDQQDHRGDSKWTSVLQRILGDNYEVIEKGLRRRFVNYDDSYLSVRNGLRSFRETLVENLSIDILVLFLGTNDTQHALNNTATSIANHFSLYKEIVEVVCNEYNVSMPKVLLISPPYIDSSLLHGGGAKVFDMRSEILSKQLHTSYADFAQQNDRSFFDAARVVGAGVEDGVHLNKAQNKALGEEIARVISSM